VSIGEIITARAPGLPRERKLAQHPLRRPDQVRDVSARRPVFAGGLLHRAKACSTRASNGQNGWSGEPVVVLDHVDPARAKVPHSVASCAGRSPIGLSAVARSGRPVTPASDRSPGIPPAAPAASGTRLGQVHVVERDVGLERRVAEQDIEELRPDRRPWWRAAARSSPGTDPRPPGRPAPRSQDVRGHPGIPRRGGSGSSTVCSSSSASARPATSPRRRGRGR